MGQVYKFPLVEISADRGRLQDIRSQLGELRFQELAEEGICQFAEQIAALAKAVERSEFEHAASRANMMRGLAREMGMRKLAGACGDARYAAEAWDDAALAAIVARIRRLLETSLLLEIIQTA